MAKPTYCYSNLNMAAPMAISASRIQRRRFFSSIPSNVFAFKISGRAFGSSSKCSALSYPPLHDHGPVRSALFLNACPQSAEPKSSREEQFASQSWEALREYGNPVCDLVCEYVDVFPGKILSELPADRGVRHKINLVSGSQYCVTRQYPLPRDQVTAIDAFFDGRCTANHMR